MAQERVVSQKKMVVVSLGKNDLRSTYNRFPSYNLKISGLIG